MLRHPKPSASGYSPSTKDQVLGVVFVVSGLLGFGLSFTMLQANGRPVLFGVCVAICVACLGFSQNKKGIGLAFIGFLAIRMIWALILRGLQK